MRETVIVEAVRTPVGKRNGGLSDMHAADLSALVLNALVERTGIDPDDRRRRGLGLRLAGRRPVEQHRPLLGAGRGLARDHPGHHGQPGVRVEPAGAGLRRAGRDVRPAGRRRRRRCRGDEPGSAGLRARHRHAVRPESACPLRRFLVQPGHLGGDDRAEVGLLARPGSTSTRRARTSRPPPRRTPARSRTRSSRCSPTASRSSPTRASAAAPPSRSWPALKPAFTEDGVIHAGNSSQISDGAAALLVMTAEKAVALGSRRSCATAPARSPAPTRC